MKKKNKFVNGETTVIGDGTVMDGNLKSNSSVRVDGTVNGDVTTESFVIVGTSGKVQGNIKASDVNIAGEVNGNVRNSGKIELAGKGKLVGDIQTASLAIEESAVFQGSCTMELETETVSDGKTGTKKDVKKEEQKTQPAEKQD